MSSPGIDYDGMMGAAKQASQASGSANVSAAQQVSPEAAAEAVKLAPHAGIPPEAIMHDPAPVKGMVGTQRATAILQTNPQMTAWANSDPAHVATTQDDFPHLDALSKVMTGFGHLVSGFDDFIARTLIASPEEQKADLADTPENTVGGQIKQDFTSSLRTAVSADSLTSLINEGFNKLYGTNTPAPASPATAAAGLLGAAFSPVTGTGTATAGKLVEAHTGIRKQIVGNLLAMLVPFGGKGARVAGEGAAGESINVNLGPRPLPGPKGAAADANIIEGEFSVVDAHKEIAQQNSDIVTSLKDSVDASKTQSRSPEVMNKFITQHVEGTPMETVNVPADQLMELYQKNGLTPMAGDGLIGDLPGVGPQLDAAIQTGGNLPVPLGYYLTHFDTAAVAALSKNISFGNIPSVEDAKAQKGTEGAAQTSMVPPEDATPEEAATVKAAEPTVQAAVEQVKKEHYLGQLFTDAKSAGMTETQFGLYSKRIEAVDAGLKTSLHKAVVDQIMKERSVEFANAVEKHSSEVAAEYNARPDVIARHVLAYGEMPDGSSAPFNAKLDRASVVKQYGTAYTQGLPQKIFGPNGVSADDVAEIFGFDNGQHMLDSFHVLEKGRNGVSPKDQIKSFVKEVATERAKAEFGRLDTPEALLDKAREAIAGPEIQRLLSDELDHLAKIVGTPLAKAELDWKVEQLFGQMRTADGANIRGFERLVARNGREAEVALLKGDYAKAFIAKQRQLLNAKMLDKAHTLAKDLTRTDKQWRKWAKSPAMDGVEQSYLNYVHAILSQAEYAVARSPEEIAEALDNVSLDQFIRDKEGEGREIFYDPWKAGKPKEIPVDDFYNLKNTITSLMANGRDAKHFIIEGRKQAMEDVLDRFAKQRDAFGDHYTLEQLKDKSMRTKIMSGLIKYDAAITIPEFLMDKLDMGDFHGVFNEIINTPFQTAKHEMDRLSSELATSFKEFGKTQPKEWQDSLTNKIDVPYDFKAPDGDTYRFIKTKGDLVAAALHWGNRENKMKLTMGFNVPAEHMQLAFDHYMKPEDWNFVQMLWDRGEELWNLARDMHGRLSGVKPPSVAPEAFTAHGTKYRGGHAPIFYDTLLGRDVKSTTGKARFGNDYMRSLPSKAYTIKRTSYVAPIELDLDTYITRLSQMIQDVTHREAIINADKLLQHPSVKYGLDRMIGQEYHHAIDSWVGRLANNRMMDDRNMAVLTNLTKTLRANMVTAEIGFKVSTIQKHGPTALVKSIDEVGAGPFVSAVQKMLQGDIIQNWQDAIAESPELQRRHTNMDRDFRLMFEATYKKQGFMTWVQQMSLMGVSFSDKLSVVPTYVAARDTALAKGETYEDAIKIGEKAARRAHGAGADVDLPALLNQKGPYGQLLKTFTPFTTFMNNGYNRIKEIGPLVRGAKEKAQGGDYAGARRDFTAAMMKTFLVALFPAVLDMWLMGEYKHKGEGFFEKAAKTMAWGYTAGMPLVSNVTGAITSGFDYKASVLDEIIQTFVQEGRDLQKLGFEGKLSPKWLQHGLMTTGYLTGLPGTRQASETGQFLYNVISGKEHPQGLAEWTHGLFHGPKKKGH